MIARHHRDDGPEGKGLEREQDEINPAQRGRELVEVLIRSQRHILQKRPHITTDERADDEINRQRKRADGHADDARHDEIMHRVNAERFERLHFAGGARGAEFNDVGRADAGEHQQRRDERAKFTDHDHDHDDAEIIHRAHPRQPGNHLPDDQQPERSREEHKHRQQFHPGAGDFLPHERADDPRRAPKLGDHHAERDERERPDALHREQKPEDDPPEEIGVRFRQRRAEHEAGGRFRNMLRIAFVHRANVGWQR